VFKEGASFHLHPKQVADPFMCVFKY
jgi:hypothetical protein